MRAIMMAVVLLTACSVAREVDGSEQTCGDCHGNPPVAPHAQRDDCATCHADAVHRNGVVEAFAHPAGWLSVHDGGTDCHSCHLDPTGPARASCSACHAPAQASTDCATCHG